jgi:hypothetical protein
MIKVDVTMFLHYNAGHTKTRGAYLLGGNWQGEDMTEEYKAVGGEQASHGNETMIDVHEENANQRAWDRANKKTARGESTQA